jgi:hypothetical protein
VIFVALNYELLGDLHPKKLTGIAIKKEQGTLVATQLYPERAFPEWSGYYKTYNDVAFGHMAPEVAEGGEDQLLNTTYSESSFTMKEYRFGGKISERAINFLLAKDSSQAVSAGQSLVQDEIEFLAETIALREEKIIIDAIIADGSTDTDVEVTTAWSSSSSTPIKDMRDATRLIKSIQHVEPDTLVINPQVEMDLLTHTDITDIVKYNGSVGIGASVVTNQGVSRSVPRIAGLDVIVSDAVTCTGITAASTETMVIGNTRAIIMKRGNYTGVTYVAEPLQVRRWGEEGSRSVRVQMFKSFVPVTFRSKAISNIIGV